MQRLALPLAFVLGIIASPLLAPLARLTPYLLMLTLLVTFLRLRLDHLRVRRVHLLLLLAQVLLSVGAYWALRPFDIVLAMAGFMICMTPTAVAMPALVGMLRGNVEFATVASVVSNLATAAVLPLMLAMLTMSAATFDLNAFGLMVWNVMSLVIIPLFAAVLLRHVGAPLVKQVVALRSLSFYLWAMTLTLVIARSTAALRDTPQPLTSILATALLSLVLCLVNFWVGRRIGGAEFRMEAGQALGQKNNLFSIWVSLSVLGSPVVALGPTFYIVWHNLINSLQLWRAHRPAASEPKV